jgi:hypothetical protein
MWNQFVDDEAANRVRIDLPVHEVEPEPEALERSVPYLGLEFFFKDLSVSNRIIMFIILCH